MFHRYAGPWGTNCPSGMPESRLVICARSSFRRMPNAVTSGLVGLTCMSGNIVWRKCHNDKNPKTSKESVLWWDVLQVDAKQTELDDNRAYQEVERCGR